MKDERMHLPNAVKKELGSNVSIPFLNDARTWIKAEKVLVVFWHSANTYGCIPDAQSPGAK